MMHGQKKIKKT